jgi:UDP-glucose 6-dehydrogenase
MLTVPKAVVVAGCGEIGKPIYQLCLSGFAQVIAEDPVHGVPEPARYPVAAMHVSIPGSLPNFIEIVDGYVKNYNPEIILINSSTVPGFTDKIVEKFGIDKVVHTQVHGKHHGGRMRRDMLRYPKFVATKSDVAFEKAREVLVTMGHPPENVIRLSSPLAGEMTKLLATTYFGYLIAWTQEIERLSDQTGVSYEELMAFTRLAADDFRIDNKFPGVIGGHCVMPNIAILKKTYPMPLWDFIEQSNEKKKAREHVR